MGEIFFAGRPELHLRNDNRKSLSLETLKLQLDIERRLGKPARWLVSHDGLRGP